MVKPSLSQSEQGISMQHCVEGSSQLMARKRGKRYKDWKGRIKLLFRDTEKNQNIDK